MKLEQLGWNAQMEKSFEPYLNKGFFPGRVCTQHKGSYVVCTEKSLLKSSLSGRFLHHAKMQKEYPVVGDWVAVKPMNEKDAVIYALLPRKSYFARKLAISGGRKIQNGLIVGGRIEEQIIGANVDTVFIVTGLDDNFNLSRIERYITLAKSSGITPVILLNKCDLCLNVNDYVEKVQAAAGQIEVHAMSVLENINMEILESFLGVGKTVVFLGSSGVGKSTLVNALFGKALQDTNTISSANGKGRHTTTSSQLLVHPSGCSVIDTPGIRELALWAEEEILSESFQDIYALVAQCKYRDCKHDKEMDCAIKKAVDEGVLSMERFNRYDTQRKELQELQRRKRTYDKNRVDKLKNKRGKEDR